MIAQARSAGEARIGTSGWAYPHWLGPVYPHGTSPDRYLALYARDLDAVEVNSSFYHLPTRAAVEYWRDQTPAGFVFAVKASRYITHMKKLNDPTTTIARFFDAIAPLGQKLGAILFQLPPRWHANVERLAAFLAALPEKPAFAFEFRDPSWFCDPVFACLAERGAAMCIHDFAGTPSPTIATAGLVYVRLHGPGEPYREAYGPARLTEWAARIRGWLGEGRDVHVYFNNDAQGHAFRDAVTLKAMIGN